MNNILYDRRYGNPSAEVLQKILKSKKRSRKAAETHNKMSDMWIQT